jgi:hypothetical protein
MLYRLRALRARWENRKARTAGANEKATRQLSGLFFQGRIVLTEGKIRQNFLAKSYGPKKGGVKEILDIKCLCFHYLTKTSNTLEKRIILRLARSTGRVKRFN